MPLAPAFHQYELKKQALIAQLEQLNRDNTPLRLHKKTSNLFRHRKTITKGINVSQFNQVIGIDKENNCVHVEGMTTYETLVNACLTYHCLPTVVPELKTITVGGALTGCGIESSSFKYGLVHETVLEFEVLLSDGRIILCRPDNAHRDLFFCFPNSYGTFGYALRVCIKLYPITPYVKLSHLHFTCAATCFEAMEKICWHSRKQGAIHFIEGVVFAKDSLYITTAEFVESAPYVSDYTYMKKYYHSIQQRAKDYLTTYDYIWRWDTDWFWCSRFFHLQHPFLRFLFGKKRLNSATYWRLRHFFSHNAFAITIYKLFHKKTESVIQDVQLPIDKATQFLSFFEKNISISPIWLCPTIPYQTHAHFDLYPMCPEQLYINFGFWGVKPWHQEDGFYNRLIENEVTYLQGRKSLYSNVYYTKDAFWQMYDKVIYQRLKKTYDPQNRLASLYEKCTEK